MSTCCSNCSATAIGGEAAAVCADCGTATVAGAPINLPLFFGVALAAGVAIFAVRLLARRTGGWTLVKRPAVA